MPDIHIVDGTVHSESLVVPVADIQQIEWRRNVVCRITRIAAGLLGTIAFFALVTAVISVVSGSPGVPEAALIIVVTLVVGCALQIASDTSAIVRLKTAHQTFEVSTTAKRARKVTEQLTKVMAVSVNPGR
jgi:hypothetical protein